MANEEDFSDYEFVDPEFETTNYEKIDFKNILYQQINYIRYLRSQDMGEFVMFDMYAQPKDEVLFTWLGNSAKFQNAVKALQSLLKTRLDEEYDIEVNKIKKKYDDLLKVKIKKSTVNFKFNSYREYNQAIAGIKREFSLTQIPNKYDEIFQQCLMLSYRAGYIGGNEYYTMTV